MERTTDEMNGSHSFEERVFARFDAIDNRFDSMDRRFDSLEVRVVKLESRQFDTKPIWERALSAIVETNETMRRRFDQLDAEIGQIRKEIGGIHTEIGGIHTEIGGIHTEIDGIHNEIGGIHTEIDGIHNEIGGIHTETGEMRIQIAACATKEEMAAGFTEMRRELDFGLRRFGRKFDVLNQNILELYSDHRYVDARLEKVEAHLKLSS